MKKLFLFIGVLLFSYFSQAQSLIKLNQQFIELFRKGDYKGALPIALKAVQQAKVEFGESSENYAISTDNVATVYNALEQYDYAMPFYKKAVKAYTVFYKGGNASAAICNNSIGNIFLIQKKYDSASVHFEKAFAFFITQPDEQYENIIVLMTNLSEVYLPLGKYTEARIVYEKVLPLVEGKEGTVNTNYTTTVAQLAGALYNLGEFALSETYAKKGLPSIEKLKGVNNTEYTELLDILGYSITEQTRFKEAEEVMMRSLKIKQGFAVQDTMALVSSYKAFGSLYGSMSAFNKAFEYFNRAGDLMAKLGMQETLEFTSLLRSFAYTCVSGGRLADAKKLLNKALIIQTKLYGKDFAINGEVLITMGNVELQLNELSAAEAHLKEGAEIAVKNYGANYYAVARAKEVLGLLYHKMGNSSKGIEQLKQALAIDKKAFGELSQYPASVLSNLGLVYQDLGNFAEAEIALTQSLEIRRKLLGTEHPDYALSLTNLAMVNVAQSRYIQADKMLAEALSIFIRKELFHSNTFISIINNIAYMAGQQGQIDESSKLFLRLLQILESREEKNTGALYLIYNNLASINLQQELYKEAVGYALKAMEYANAHQGIRSLEYIKSGNNLAVAYRHTGDLKKERDLTNELIPLCKEVMGKDANMLAILYYNTSMMENSENNFDKAGEYLDQALTIYLNNFRNNFYTLSEKEKLTWWQDQSSHFAMFPSLLKQSGKYNAAMVSAMANHQLQLKGFVLNDASAALRKARASGNVALQKLIDQWQFNRTLLAKQLAIPVNERFYSTDSLEQVANTFEKSINQQASGIINTQQHNNNWKTIQAALKPGEAAIEFIRFPFFRNTNYTDTLQYAAIIIRNDQPTPNFVLLGTEEQISWCLTGNKDNNKEARIGRLYRSSLSSKSTGSFAGDSLYKLIWQPLMPYLQNINTVSYAPDGLLHKVAFHALPINKTTLLIDTFNLEQYTSIRQVLDKGTGIDKLNSVYMVGDADFNSTATTTPTNDGIKVTFTANRSATNAWSALPGTAKEISTLQQLFNNKGIKVSAASGSNATEDAFKNLNGHSPSIIHLATHGFFLPDPAIKQKTPDALAIANTYASSEEPLMRSGVVMAGANKAWSGEKIPAGAEDGIVTAYEIAQLNLSNTQLVALSACETALGDLQGTEGVFGLQRAFKIAGVKNLIVSLWQVPDKETAELMGIFYNRLLSGDPVRKAFNLAQKEMRGKYSPFSWAAFVLIE